MESAAPRIKAGWNVSSLHTDILKYTSNTLAILCDVLRQDGMLVLLQYRMSVYPLKHLNTLAILCDVLRQDGMLVLLQDRISVYSLIH